MSPFVIAWLVLWVETGSIGRAIENQEFPTRQACEEFAAKSEPRMPDYFRGMQNLPLTAQVEIRWECISKLDLPVREQPGKKERGAKI